MALNVLLWLPAAGVSYSLHIKDGSILVTREPASNLSYTKQFAVNSCWSFLP